MSNVAQDAFPFLHVYRFRRHAEVIEAGIPNSRRVIVDDAGHLVCLEKPEEFSRIVISFILANKD
ncbi:MAG TPA: alpha/beta hydrolase [Candidatus Limnocylindrales bacterium]|nr:alpha/beta hydrolase [Candidatus Limnocylindrales bacterium]